MNCRAVAVAARVGGPATSAAALPVPAPQGGRWFRYAVPVRRRARSSYGRTDLPADLPEWDPLVELWRKPSTCVSEGAPPDRYAGTVLAEPRRRPADDPAGAGGSRPPSEEVAG